MNQIAQKLNSSVRKKTAVDIDYIADFNVLLLLELYVLFLGELFAEGHDCC